MAWIRSCILALVVAAAFELPAATVAGAQELTPQELARSTLLTVSQINRRQIRDERIVLTGFGIIALLLIGLGLVSLRQPVVPLAAESLGRAGEIRQGLADRFARERMHARMWSIARRQRRIEKLMADLKMVLADNLDTSARFRGALDRLGEEVARLEAEFNEARARADADDKSAAASTG